MPFDLAWLVYTAVGVAVVALAAAAAYVCVSRRYRLNWFERTLLLDSQKGGGGDKAAGGATPSGCATTPVPPVKLGHVYLQPGASDHHRPSVDSPTSPHWPQAGSTSSSKTPTSSSSMQEMMFSFPPAWSESRSSDVGLPVMPSAGHRQRRRASMQDALDHTKINTQLYDDVRPSSSASIRNSIEEENVGALQLSVRYDCEQSLLVVRLINALGLLPRDLATTGNPYCKLTLLPGRRVQLQSKVCTKTLSPSFDEEFIFDVPRLATIPDLTLEVLIYDYDQFSRDECIGAVHLALAQLELAGGVTATVRKGISAVSARKEESEAQGDLMLSISYLQSAERLTVVVMKARNLLQICTESAKNSTNPFVKVSLLCDGKRSKKKKTTTKRNSLNPVWHEALTFDVSRQQLAAQSMCIEVVAYHDSVLANNECLGRIMIGPRSHGEQLAHWNDVCRSKNAISRWHQLVLPGTDAASTNSG